MTINQRKHGWKKYAIEKKFVQHTTNKNLLLWKDLLVL